MVEENNYQMAVEKMRLLLPKIQLEEDVKQIVRSKDIVFGKFRPIFSRENVQNLSEGDFKSFLLFGNNLHWTGLHRQSPKICADMEKLRFALTNLLDEEKSIDYRMNEIIDSDKGITGMGKATTTAVLLVAFPEKYGAWNNISEGALKKFNLWPAFERGTSAGKKYKAINEVLLKLASDLKVDLWTLDAFWWLFKNEEIPENPELSVFSEIEVAITPESQRFAEEIHLHKFLLENWEKINIVKEWTIFSEDGEDAAGYEYPCSVGRIDLLARHKTNQNWLVVELKKNKSSDSTIGQILRYIGWVKKNLAMPEEEVYGLIIAHEIDERLKYALSVLSNVDAVCYEVDFHLNPCKDIFKNFV